MATLPILHFPDPKLKERSRVVTESINEIKGFLHDLVRTMESFPGCVGLAAPQVGRLIRVAAMDVRRYRKPVEGHGLQVLVNPIILNARKAHTNREGCLSVTDYTGSVVRYQEVLVEATNMEGESIWLHAKGFEAIVLQHEIDHLDGMLFLDRVASLKTDIFRRKDYLH